MSGIIGAVCTQHTDVFCVAFMHVSMLHEHLYVFCTHTNASAHVCVRIYIYMFIYTDRYIHATKNIANAGTMFLVFSYRRQLVYN